MLLRANIAPLSKTQIAIEFCHRRQQLNPKCSVFWVNAATTARFEESFRRIATLCGLTKPEDCGSELTFVLKNWPEFQHKHPWLMVIDNVDDKNVFFRQKNAKWNELRGVYPDKLTRFTALHD